MNLKYFLGGGGGGGGGGDIQGYRSMHIGKLQGRAELYLGGMPPPP